VITLQVRARSNSHKRSALRGLKDDIAERERKGAFKQVMGATDTAAFLQELARKIKKLVANFIVRGMDRLPPLFIGRLTLRSSKAISTLSRLSTA
jgi:hypothetical protein